MTKSNKYSNQYWKYGEAVCGWGYFFIDNSKIMNNQSEFLFKIFSLAFKYGINMPNCEYGISGNKLKEFIDSKLPLDYNNNWLNLVKYYYSESDSAHIYKTYLSEYESEGGINLKLKNNEEQQLFTLFENLTSKDEYCIYFELKSNCFFNTIDKVYIDNIPQIIDNTRLAFLNTPRINSYLRGLSYLMFEYGAKFEEFSNYNEGEDSSSIQFKDSKITIKEEILFQEDINMNIEPNILYNPLETIELKIDKRNYEEYIKQKKN